MKKQHPGILAILPLLSFAECDAVTTIPVTNAGFEDTTGQTTFNEFTFGVPQGWAVYDPFDVHPSAGLFIGTLRPNGTEFFNSTAPEGNRVAILFNSSRRGEGEYGYSQELSVVAAAFRKNRLTVMVGNIASGTDEGGTFYNLDEFPGYRVELMAGGTVLSMDDNSLSIAEGEFATSTVTFTTGASHAQLGQNLGIRLISENILPPGSPAFMEVDFDDVGLTVDPVPEPQALILCALGLGALAWRRSRVG